jgi:outer membrane protein assembly factor BamB/tetratricopeptide (TPR) repeat protein
MAHANRHRWNRGLAPRALFHPVVLTAAITLYAAVPAVAAGQPPAPVAIDRDLQQPFAEAQTLIARRRFSDAMRILQSILSQPKNKLAFLNGRYIDAKVVANRMIGAFPPEALAGYEQEFGKFADDELRRAEASGKVEEVLRVFTSYRHASAGKRALAVAAGTFFDRGQFVEAAAASRELTELSQAADQPAAAAWLVLSWARTGQSERARRWIDEHRATLSQKEVQLQNRSGRLDAWLDQLIKDSQTQATAKPAGILSCLGGHPQHLAAQQTLRPTTLSLWKKRLSAIGNSGAMIDELVARRAASGVAPVFHGVPLVIGETVVVRTGEEIASYDLRSGRSVWSHDIAPAGSNSDSGNGFHESTIPLVTETLVDRLFAGAPHTAISTDGERVFTVVEDVAPAAPVFTRRRRFAQVESPPKNSLVAFAAASGKRLWRLSEIEAPGAESAGDTRDIDFLGPPLAYGGTLYVLARTEDAAHLLAVNPLDGKINWSQSLAGFSGFEADSVSWSGPSCMPVESDGLLLCPTPDGLVIAVDLITHAVRWAYRVEQVDEPARMPPRWGRAFAGAEARWLSTWRETSIRTDGPRCFFISPRSPQVYALDIKTGELVWSRPVPGGLFLGPVEQGRLIAVAKFRCRSLEGASGRPLWNVPIGLPSGRGLVLDAKYYLPCTNGTAIQLDLRDGEPGPVVAAANEMLGNLVPVVSCAGVAAVGQSHEQLIALPELETERRQVVDKLQREPNNAELGNRLALLEREAGDFASAERRLEKLIATPARKTETGSKKEMEPPPARFRHELLETLLADVEATPRRSAELAEQVERNSDSQQWARSLRTLALARRRAGQPLDAFQMLLRLATSELPPTLEVEPGPARIVAFDRQLRADLMDLLSASPLPTFREARALLFRTLRTALADGDFDTLRRVSDRLGFAEWDPELRRQIEIALRPEPGYLTEELTLWGQAAHSDRPRSAESLRKLAELYFSHGERKLAAGCFRRLRDDFADVRFADGAGPLELIRRARQDRRLTAQIEMSQPDGWAAARPQVRSDATAGSSANFYPLPMERSEGSLFERIDVAIDRDGKTLRFQGEPRTTHWEVTLPAEAQSFRGYQMLHRGWGIGNLLIVQEGGDLYGVKPLDDGGEANPKVLWHVDLLPVEEVASTEITLPVGRGIAGLFTDRSSMIDHLGRAVAKIVAVLPGAICCLDRGTLSAFDPVTGRLLWRRSDAASLDLGSGDESLILLLDRRSKRVEFIRALDGKRIASRDLLEKGSEVRWLEGRDALVQSVDPHGLRASRIDLLTGQVRWTHVFTTASHLARLDSRRYAVSEPDGTCHIMNASTGDLVTTQMIAGTEHCLQLHSTRDERRFYVAFSKPFAESENFRQNAQRDESRNPLFNGMLCAFDRSSGRLLWNRRFDDGVFEIDQSRVAPALVFSYRHVEKGDDEGGIPWPYLHAIDKRTGSDIYLSRLTSLQPASHPLAETDTARHEFQVRVPEAVVHFQYAK